MTWRRISVVLTSACNLRCRYCCLERGSARVLDWDALRGSREVLLPLCQERIDVTFTGGEPLLAAPTLRRAVSYIEQRIDCSRIQWRVLTNGLLLDRDTLSFLDAHGFIVNLSFDGVPAAHAQR